MCEGGQFYCKVCKIFYWQGKGIDDYLPCDNFEYCRLSDYEKYETDFCDVCILTKNKEKNS